MKNRYKKIIIILSVLIFSTACENELDTEPLIELSLENLLKQDPNAINGLMSKMYATFALTGSKGPASSDVAGPDPGETAFLRGIINLQDFSADGMKNLWGDDGLDQLTTTSGWNQNNKFFRYLYDRVYFTVPQCNNIILALNANNVPNTQQYLSELRFIRSLAYFYMIDCFGKGVLVTENELGSSTPAPQASRVELFNFVESELLAIENTIPQTSDYGRANKSTVRMLLAKLYLNAEVYTGTPRYTDALTYAKKVIDLGGYSLATDFLKNFSADNNTSPEIIFPLIADAAISQSYGNSTYIVNGGLSTATMTLATWGATEGWGGHRATKSWYGLFGNSAAALTASNDDRAKLFWTTGHTFEMTNYKTWINGFPSTKFRNTNFSGTSVPTKFSNTDFPMFRLADAYLIYSECVLRGATGGSNTVALQYVNDIRRRSHANLINTADLTLDFILDERGRELNLEGHRRTDLIRFGKFTGGAYVWPWKGNDVNGTAIPSHYNLFPIPIKAIQANPNLTQNPGY
jgi:starch-binding outer membrane protein, SusD/RagB family